MKIYNFTLVLVLLFLVLSLVFGSLNSGWFFGVDKSQIAILLCMILFSLLWYNDVISLGMNLNGIMTTRGVYPLETSETPAIYLFSINGISMVIIGLWFFLESSAKLSIWSIILLAGIIIFLTFCFYLGRIKPHTKKYGKTLMAIYHFILIFILIPGLVLAVAN